MGTKAFTVAKVYFDRAVPPTLIRGHFGLPRSKRRKETKKTPKKSKTTARHLKWRETGEGRERERNLKIERFSLVWRESAL
jgi:hypothetical protein